MIITRKESWGRLFYDTSVHSFRYELSKEKKEIGEQPYIDQPILLNLDLTFKCNMQCRHCVAKDMEDLLGGTETSDLVVTKALMEHVNKSPFMVIVITGGEPLVRDYEGKLVTLINGLKNKGIVVDTNGTITPSSKLMDIFKEKNVMVRVSWDSPNPLEEYKLRQYPQGLYKGHDEYMERKQDLIRLLVKKGIMVSIQSVMHNRNYADRNLEKMPSKFKELGINKWFIQRYIPTDYNQDDKKYILEIDKYESSTNKLIAVTQKFGINIYTKRDRRHNSVFLLVKDGDLYTQSDDKVGEKVLLGNISNYNEYFEFVSGSDHTVRYVNDLKSEGI